MEIIVPAAGLSTRFPGTRPKYLLFDYKNEMMLKNALAPYIGVHNITIGILQEHEDKYQSSEYIRNEVGDVNIVILKERTSGPADTVYQIIQQSGISDESEILIKDCDNFFDHDYSEGNYICVSNIAEHEVLKKLSSKSFVISNDQGIITNIIEKNVVSDTFCVGGYKFESAKLFKDTFKKLSKNIPEVFVSHVIQDCLMNDVIFTEKEIFNYIDVGTAQDWFEFNDKPVIFCDIDGTIIKAQTKYGKDSYLNGYTALKDNVKCILDKIHNGSQVIFTTARRQESYAETVKMLDELGFRNYNLLMGLNSSSRMLINDYNDANPHPRAIAINIKRDSDNLKDFL
jgi:hypothetical protein